MVVPTEVPKPVGWKEKVRAEDLTARPLPRSGDEFATPKGQWGSGPPKDKRRVVVDEGQTRVDRRERREEEKGEDDKSRTPEERSTEVASTARRQSEESKAREVPVFDDMEEPTAEIAVLTTAREEGLKKVSEKVLEDGGELSPQVVDENRQKYKDMLSSLAMRDAAEEEYRKTRGVEQPYRGMTRPPWQRGRLARVAEEMHTVYLQDKWAKMEVRNLKRFVVAVGGLTALELTRLGAKPK